MFFVGIDVGKRHHEACIIDAMGQTIGKTLRFANTQSGGQKLLAWLRKVDQSLTSTCVAMEATGHYWLALHSFLRKNGLTVRVINPIQSDSFRNLYIRQTKMILKMHSSSLKFYALAAIRLQSWQAKMLLHCASYAVSALAWLILLPI